MEFQTKLATVSYLQGHRDVSGSSCSSPGDPESSSFFLCIERDDREKWPALGKGPGALLPAVQSSRTLGVDEDLCRTRGSGPHFVPVGFVPQHCFFGHKG